MKNNKLAIFGFGRGGQAIFRTLLQESSQSEESFSVMIFDKNPGKIKSFGNDLLPASNLRVQFETQSLETSHSLIYTQPTFVAVDDIFCLSKFLAELDISKLKHPLILSLTGVIPTNQNSMYFGLRGLIRPHNLTDYQQNNLIITFFAEISTQNRFSNSAVRNFSAVGTHTLETIIRPRLTKLVIDDAREMSAKTEPLRIVTEHDVRTLVMLVDQQGLPVMEKKGFLEAHVNPRDWELTQFLFGIINLKDQKLELFGGAMLKDKLKIDRFVYYSRNSDPLLNFLLTD